MTIIKLLLILILMLFFISGIRIEVEGDQNYIIKIGVGSDV